MNAKHLCLGLEGAFEASKSSSVYTNDGVVRPNAYTVHIWKRTE